MAKQLKIHGFIIRVGKGSLCKIEKPGSTHNGALMIVAPFSLYNIRTTTRRFANEYYDYIVKGVPQKTEIKADYAFSDSLINKQVKPHKTISGYIRIPFIGRGLYGVRFLDVNNKTNRNITWAFNKLPTQSVAINREGTFVSALSLDIYQQKKKKNKRDKKSKNSPATASKTPIIIKPKKKKHYFGEEKPLINSDGKDMYDLAGEYAAREVEFGHGRRKSDEWNNAAALDLRRELDKLRSIQKNDPNTFDRGAMK